MRGCIDNTPPQSQKRRKVNEMEKRKYRLDIETDNGNMKYYGMFKTSKKAWKTADRLCQDGSDFVVSLDRQPLSFDEEGKEIEGNYDPLSFLFG